MLKGLGLAVAGGTMGLSIQGRDLRMQEKSIPGAGTAPANSAAEPMKIIKVESIRFSDRINIGGGSGGDGKAEFCWVRIHTNTGITGIGETYPSINGETRKSEAISPQNT